MGPDPDSEPLVTPASAEPAEPVEPSPSAPSSSSSPTPSASDPGRRGGRSGGRSESMLPRRERRSGPELLLVRLVATCGIVGIGVAIGAILVSSGDQGWIVGLIVSIVSVALAGLLWSSRVL